MDNKILSEVYYQVKFHLVCSISLSILFENLLAIRFSI
jgi:hypothetical protein